MHNKFQSLELQNIRKEFPGVLALDGVSLKAEAGKVHALMGENGAGKSTLIKILAGAYSKDQGKMLINNNEINIFFDFSQWKKIKISQKKTSLLFQEKQMN